jgi:hypothetical protein
MIVMYVLHVSHLRLCMFNIDSANYELSKITSPTMVAITFVVIIMHINDVFL